ncbi:MAG: hypothetical protein HMLIMOIP_000866 [Candidatus Nitrosomirales archaeon]|jgi:hypothetical protein
MADIIWEEKTKWKYSSPYSKVEIVDGINLE